MDRSLHQLPAAWQALCAADRRHTPAARRKLGYKVVILDPFKIVTPKPDTFNSLQFIDKESPTAIDECRDLAEALVIRKGQEKEPFWNDSAEVWIAAMTAAGERLKKIETLDRATTSRS